MPVVRLAQGIPLLRKSWIAIVACIGVGLTAATATDLQFDQARAAVTILRFELARILPAPATTWPVKAPADAGFDPAKLEEFGKLIGHLSSGCVIKDGSFVYGWGAYDRHDDWASATKPIFSTLMLFALHERRIGSVDDLIAAHWPELREADRTMTYRHLANMTSGYTLPEGPGQRWAYNDFGMKLFFLTLLKGVFGVPPDDPDAAQELLAAPHRLGPLAFEDGRLFYTRHGVPRLFMSPRDYARVGQFWLQKGKWNGRQILPPELFEQYVHADVAADLPRTKGGPPDDYLGIGTAGGGNDGYAIGPGSYGLAWWFNADRGLWPDLPADAFQANGHHNANAMTIIPSHGIVVAWVNGSGVAGNRDDLHERMNAALKMLLQALRPTPVHGVAAHGGRGYDRRSVELETNPHQGGR